MQPFGRPQQVLGQNDPSNPQFDAKLNAPQPGGGLGMQQRNPPGNNAMKQIGGQQQGLRQNCSPGHFSETSQDLRETAMMDDFFDRINEEKGSPLSDREHDDLMNAWFNSMETPSPPVRPAADARPPSPPVRPEADARLPPTPTPVKSEAVVSPHTVPAELPGTNEREPALAAMNEVSGPLSPVESMPTSSSEANDAAQTSPP